MVVGGDGEFLLEMGGGPGIRGLLLKWGGGGGSRKILKPVFAIF